ncbi:MAG: hypothetical protein AAB866_03045 [Patescibacteria group bacterium]
MSKIEFDDEEKLREFLRKCWRSDPWWDEEIIEHERAHFDKAKELGYNPRYLVEYIQGTNHEDDGIYQFIQAFVKHSSVSDKDLLAICLAPKDLSKGDIRIAKRLGWKPEENNYVLDGSLK